MYFKFIRKDTDMYNVFVYSVTANAIVGVIRKEGNVFLSTHSTHFIYGYMASDITVKDHS